jgi:hypothetical protein
MMIQGHRMPAEVDWEMRSLLWVLILEGRKLEIRTLALGTNSILDVIGQFWPKILYVVSERGGVQRVQRLSLLWPTPNYLWDSGQTKDNPQSRHHTYTADDYYSTTTSDVP